MKLQSLLTQRSHASGVGDQVTTRQRATITDSVLPHIACCALCWCADVGTIIRQVQAFARSALVSRIWIRMYRSSGIQCAGIVVGPVDRDRSGRVCAAV